VSEIWEDKILAGCLRDLDNIERCREANIERTHFRDGIFRVIYEFALRYSKEERELLTSDALQMKLRRAGQNPDKYLTSYSRLLSTTCSKGEFSSALSQMKEQRILREVEDAVENTISRIEKKEPAEEIAKDFRRKALEVGRSSGVSYSEEGYIRDSTDDRFREIEEKQLNPHLSEGLLSPWTKFNQATNGLGDAELVVMIADPGQGKTTWMLSYAEEACTKYGKHGVFFSYEMPKKRLELRVDTRVVNRLFPDRGITYRKIKDGRLTSDELKCYKEALDYQKSLEGSLYVVDDPSMTVPDIQAKLEQLKDQQKVDFAVIDYIGLLPGAAEGWNIVNALTAQLYVIGRETKVPIITAAQRNPEGNVGLSYLIKAHGSLILQLLQTEDQRVLNEIEQDFIKAREGPRVRWSCITNFDCMAIEDLQDIAIGEEDETETSS